MAVAHDAASESHTGTTGSTSEASFSWTHTPSGTPAGVLVFTFVFNSATELVSSVTYNSVTVPAVSSGSATDTAGEGGRCTAWFLTPVDAGAQTVLVNRTNNATEMYAIAITFTADGTPSVTGVATENESQALTEENVDDGSPGTDSVRYAATYWGGNAAPAAGANSTALQDIVVAATRAARAVRETTAGQGSRPVGFSQGAADDVAAVYLAVKETVASTPDWFSIPIISNR